MSDEGTLQGRTGRWLLSALLLVCAAAVALLVVAFTGPAASCVGADGHEELEGGALTGAVLTSDWLACK